MRATDRAGLEDYLAFQGIAFRTVTHAPVFTVADGAEIKAAMPGGHTKNLFLDDRRGGLFLVSALAETPVPVNGLHRILGSKRLSFGAPGILAEKLGVTPGSVTIFAMIHDRARDVVPVLDRGLFDHDIVHFHPLRNDATTAIAPQDVVVFLKSLGRDPLILDFETLARGG